MTAYEGSKNDEIENSKTKLLRPKTNPTKNRDQDHIVSYLLGGMLKTTAFRVKKSKRMRENWGVLASWCWGERHGARQRMQRVAGVAVVLPVYE